MSWIPVHGTVHRVSLTLQCFVFVDLTGCEAWRSCQQMRDRHVSRMPKMFDEICEKITCLNWILNP